MSAYFEALCAAMKLCADAGAVFMGQSVRDGGTAMASTFRDVPRERLIELPVFENTQLGMATGAALASGLVVTCYPRINFLLEATSQLVQHLDKLPIYSDGRYRPRVIIRTAVASPEPLDPGAQHLGDYTHALRQMLQTIRVVQLHVPDRIVPEYERALELPCSTLLIEYLGLYNP